ncbi:MAG: CHRD domain-containing protein [Gaiellaceae bacterium]|jgi:CHRD domain
MRSPLLVSAALAIVMTFAGLTLAAPQATSYKLTSTLKASSEVPKPAGAKVGATGTFTGTAVQATATSRAALTWKLTFAKLTGPAAAAHIHIGKPGKAGNVMVALCGPCRSGQRGSARVTNAQLKTIRAGGAYVNLHTKTNAAGEIRGQVKASKGSNVAPAPPPPPSPEPPPPPDYPYP